MTTTSGARHRRALTTGALALAFLVAACSGPGAGAGSGSTAGPTTSDAPASSRTADPRPTDGAASLAAGDRTLLDVDRLTGEMTWDGRIDWSGEGRGDTWNVNVDLVLQRSDQHGSLVFAKGSRFSADWEGPKPDPIDLCQTYTAHWTGPISTPSGEGIDQLSDPKPMGLGLVHEDLDTLSLDISIFGFEPAQYCDAPGAKLSCPMLGGNKTWDLRSMQPARLELTCNEVSPDTATEKNVVNVTGRLAEDG